jgi:hypothetical protein
MKLSDILHDALGVIELLKPHVRDDGDQYHAQLANSLQAAHGAAVESRSDGGGGQREADRSRSGAARNLEPRRADREHGPQTEPVLNAIEALGSHLSDLTATVHDVRAALAAPAPQQPAV